MAALSLLVGMGSAAYRSGTAFDASFDRAMPLCAALLCSGALLAFARLGPITEVPHRVHWHTHGRLTEPPAIPRIAHRRTRH